MTKLQAEMLRYINRCVDFGAYTATDWATDSLAGSYTPAKMMRRVWAIIDLGKLGEIRICEGGKYHSHAKRCEECHDLYASAKNKTTNKEEAK